MRRFATVAALFAGSTPTPLVRVPSLMLHMHARCSLRCPYCVNNMHNPARRMPDLLLDRIGPEAYLARLDAIMDWSSPVAVTLGGGECTESRHFVPLMRGLLGRGPEVTIHLATNLRGVANVEEAVRGMPFEEVHRRVSASVSYHLGTFLDGADCGGAMRARFIDDLWPRAVVAGVRIGSLITPMTPACLADPDYLDDVRRMLAVWPKARPVPTELYHVYRGLPYPASYTVEERERLRAVQQALGHDAFNQGNADPGEVRLRPEATPWMVNWLEVPGAPCWVSSARAEVRYDGTIRRCRHTPQVDVGKLGEFTGRLFGEGAEPCPGQRTGCKGICLAYCLRPAGVHLDEYFFAWYAQQGKPEVAELFGGEA
jgi:hypothetical protein